MKNERQLKILEIIAEKEIRTQEDLCAALSERGFSATQATVSRDIKELHLQKVPSENGGTKYVVAEKKESAPENTLDKYKKVLTHVLTAALPAGNIAVIKTLSGTANAAAAALEALRCPEIIGTLAGDDSLLVLFADNPTAALFCDKINTTYLKEE